MASALVALVFIGWFLVLYRNERLGSAAADRVFEQPRMSDAEWTATLDDFKGAELLDPGSEWTVQRAGALILRDKAAATRLAESVLSSEPENFEAWLVVYRANARTNPRRASRALAEIRRLDPLVSQR